MGQRVNIEEFDNLDEIDRRSRLVSMTDDALLATYEQLRAPVLLESRWLPLIVQELNRRGLKIPE